MRTHRPVPGGVIPLFVAAMVIFIITVIIGILNGIDLVEFDRNTLLTHVHAGTLGWITLSVLAAGTWMFWQEDRGGPPPILTAGTIAAVAFYVFAFWWGRSWLRPVAGSLALVAFASFALWIFARRRDVPMTVARLGMLAALLTLVIGGVFGVLLGLAIAGSLDLEISRLAIAHPSTMVIGYLILAGMAIVEWRLGDRDAPRLTKPGIAQVALLFLGGLSLTVGALLNFFPLILLNVPFEIVGVIIFLVRMRRPFARIPWLEPGPRRHLGAAMAFLALNVGLIAFLIGAYADEIQAGDPAAIPGWLIFALDHSMFIGVITNAIFALLFVVTAAQIRRWAQDVAFWAVNVGIAGFVVGLMVESAVLKRVFTPIMGAGILLALLGVGLGLASARTEQAPASTPSA